MFGFTTLTAGLQAIAGFLGIVNKAADAIKARGQEEQGRVAQTAQDQAKVIENVKKANEASADVERDVAAGKLRQHDSEWRER